MRLLRMRSAKWYVQAEVLAPLEGCFAEGWLPE
jgi:hypothetical protein